MSSLPDNSVDLIATDPPYFRVKNLPWDRQWENPAKFIDWIGELCREWHRLLKPNGSLYVFASPKMAARVEVSIGEWFEVLNRIRWQKANGWHRKAEQEALRSYLSPWEEIIFAEQFGADSHAKGEAGYSAKCDELRGFVFEPLRAYLDGERIRLGWNLGWLNETFGWATTGSGWARDTFTRLDGGWNMVTADNYLRLQQLAGGRAFHRPYEDLRREYEDLRLEYEGLRRPFTVSADVPYTDVWDFPTVSTYPGKHPCEKPLEMMRHIVRASSRPGAMVLDCFAGSGVTGCAAKQEGRSAILIEKDETWVQRMHARFAVEQETQIQPKTESADDLPLFVGSHVAAA